MKNNKFPKGDVKEIIRRFLKSGQTAVDVGAGIGEMSAVMADCVGDTGHVIAFEPYTNKTSGSFAKSLSIVTTRATVDVRVTALGECVGECTLFRANTTCASRWHGDPDSIVTVPMTTLDAELPTETVDLVKMDVQGSEGHVLDGATALLKRCPVWILEFWPWGLQTAGRTCQSVIDQLRSAGLTPHWPHGATIDADGVQTFLDVRNRDTGHVNIYATR